MTLYELLDYLYRVNGFRWRYNALKLRRELIHLPSGTVIRIERVN